jgi:hypothetical protein
MSFEAPAMTPAEIAALRPLMGLAWLDSCELLRSTWVDDGAGGGTTAESVVATSPCRLLGTQLRPTEQAVAARLQWAVAYAIQLPYDTTATPADRLRVNAGREFEVGGVVVDGRLGMFANAVCREVSGGE